MTLANSVSITVTDKGNVRPTPKDLANIENIKALNIAISSLYVATSKGMLSNVKAHARFAT